jgi:hypothetical protein
MSVRTNRIDPCLTEFVAVNDGDSDSPLPRNIAAKWAGAELVACDAIGGMQVEAQSTGEVNFAPRVSPADRVRPAEARVIGWLRLARQAEVHVDVAE